MTALAYSARIVRNAAYVGWQSRIALFTWRTWTFGWVLRLVMQVLFFALIGRLLGSDAAVHFLFVGNVAAVAALGCLAVIADTLDERYEGTLPMLVAAPGSLVSVLAGRTMAWMLESVVTASIAFFVLAPVLDFPLGMESAWLPLLLGVVAFANYGFGIALASLVIRWPRWGNTLFNLVYWFMAAICGVNVRLEFFPGWVQAIAKLLPLTHGLEAIRRLFGDQGAGAVLSQVGPELLVGAVWLGVALVGFRLFAEGGRRDGTLDLIA